MLKNIMCFGDSNTYGFIAGSGGRYGESVRWTRLLQKKLGYSYYVIEEGLNGRTTAFDDPDSKYMNASEYIEMCVSTHKPLDLVIIMLGTNDVKTRYGATAKDIAEGMAKLIRIIRDQGTVVKEILVVSPIHISDNILQSEYCDSFGGLEGVKLSKEISGEYAKLAAEFGCHFLDAAEYAEADNKDAIHLDIKAHGNLADAMYDKIQQIEKSLKK